MVFLLTQGTEGFERHMDRLMELTEYMVKRIKQMPDKYYLILEPEMVNVCFWYLPTRVRNMPHTSERIKILADVRLIPSFSNPIVRCLKPFNDPFYVRSREFIGKAKEKSLLADLSDPEGSNDASWHADGRVPAGRPTTQLLQEHYLERRGDGSGRGLPAGRNGPVRPRSVRNLPVLTSRVISHRYATELYRDTASKVVPADIRSSLTSR